MSPEECDAWYRTPRGAWIGDAEYRLLRRLLAPNGLPFGAFLAVCAPKLRSWGATHGALQ